MGDGNESAVEETGFNDAELEEIMDEIENLESDDSPSNELKTPAPVEEEVVSEPVKLAESAPTPQKTNLVEMSAPASTSSAAQKSGTSSKSRMAFHVEGDMQVDLDFYVAGESIKLTLDGEKGLVIGLQSGAKFCVPLTESKNQKAS